MNAATTSFREKLTAWLPRFVLLFCVVQPILDVLTYWQETLGYSNVVTFLIRVLLISVLIWVGFLLSRKKWVYFLCVGVLLVFGLPLRKPFHKVNDLVDHQLERTGYM